MKALVTRLVVLVSLVFPGTASAFTAIGPGTSTGGFDVGGSAVVAMLGLVGPEMHRGNVQAWGETSLGSSSAARGAETAFEIAKAGGKHAGTLKNYAGRSVAEIKKAIGSYERVVAIHRAKIANPAQFAERWGEMGAREQAGLVNKWGADAARNQELADVLRGLLGSR